MRCKAGDLAVVLSAVHKSNVGKFVNVIKLYPPDGGVNLAGDQRVWLVESYAPLTWRTGKKLWCGILGPVPDSALQPIRGLPLEEVRSTGRTLQETFPNHVG